MTNTQEQIRLALLQLARDVGGEKGETIASVAELLDLQLTEMCGGGVQQDALNIVHLVELLQIEVTSIKTMFVARLNAMDRTVDDQHATMRQKLHSVSNFIMSLEHKIDELAELLMHDDAE